MSKKQIARAIRHFGNGEPSKGQDVVTTELKKRLKVALDTKRKEIAKGILAPE